MASWMTEADQYILGYREAEQQRLQRQAEELAGEAEWLLDQVGPLDGQRVVEIGCGPRGCLDLLAARVGPQGHVVGVERSDEAVEFARRLIADRGFSNVEVICGDVRANELRRESFDLATARLVLVNVPAPEDIVHEAVALVRPGGRIAWHDADWALNLCDPPLAAWDRITELFKGYADANGIDLFVGRRVPRLLREAGVVDVQSRLIVHTYEPGHPRRAIFHDFVGNLGGRFVEAGIVDEDELEGLSAELLRHLDDPDTYVISHLFTQAWGRKPL